MKVVIENAIIILSLCFLAFIALDYFNQKMDFLGNTVSVEMLTLFCILSLGNSIYVLTRKKKKIW